MPVEQDDGGVAVGVAEDDSVGYELAPKEWQQQLAALLGGVGPEGVAERFGLLHAGFFAAHQLRIDSAEHLLPAQTVGGDQDEVLGLVVRGLQSTADDQEKRQESG